MYDLSGLKPEGETCDSIIEDWKYLVDSLEITRQKTNNYLYHHNKPLVAIWGLGFPDRPYNIRNIGFEKLLDFLKHDENYGGCSILLGVPTYFRDLNADCLPDPYLHKLIRMADIVLPWMGQRFTPLLHQEMDRFRDHVKADLDWCRKNGVEYVPTVYPGFSWHNLHNGDPVRPLDQIPRLKGKFYWDLISTSIEAGAEMLYVAMFDEVDEGTAIFKCSNTPPIGIIKFVDYEGLPTDHYLKLTGKAGQMLRKEIPFTKNIDQVIE